jgi:hypothetical protein
MLSQQLEGDNAQNADLKDNGSDVSLNMLSAA